MSPIIEVPEARRQNMPALGLSGPANMLVDEFFDRLRHVAEGLLESPLDRYRDVPVAVERISRSREHTAEYHRQIASMAFGEYAHINAPERLMNLE